MGWDGFWRERPDDSEDLRPLPGPCVIWVEVMITSTECYCAIRYTQSSCTVIKVAVRYLRLTTVKSFARLLEFHGHRLDETFVINPFWSNDGNWDS